MNSSPSEQPDHVTGQPDPVTPKRGVWKRRFVILLIVVFMGVQFVPVDRQNPEVVADIHAPENVKAILRRACYDCHSNETRWPWYSHIAPGSWLMARDVVEGRNALNFSEWGSDFEEEETPEYFVDMCWDSIESGQMPLWFYLPLHPEAKLTEEDLAVLKKWCGIEDEAEEVANANTSAE